MRAGKKLSTDAALAFCIGNDVLDRGAKDAVCLLETGHLPKRDPSDWQNIEYMAGEEYIALLENGDTDWYTKLQLACAYYENRQFDQAKEAFLASWN
ncbi:MAG: hypothetical protein IJ985_06325, partial [Akkermansia sp.]|nr:hypothetical protein [Akkermansia sp.]